MEFSQIRLLLGLLREAGIPVCIVGELALNYYNAPRVVHVGTFSSHQSLAAGLYADRSAL